MSSWEEKFRTMKEKSTFCGDLTKNIELDDVRKEEFSECMLNPLKYVERNYRKVLSLFEGVKNPEIRKLLECKQTKVMLNLIAKKIDPMASYEINYCEGIPKVLDDLEKWSEKRIEPLDEEEKTRRFRKVEACLPTESYIIEQEKKKREGISTIQKLKSLLVLKQTEPEIIPHSIAVTHEFEHFFDPNKNDPQDIKQLQKDRFDILKQQKLILRRKRNQ